MTAIAGIWGDGSVMRAVRGWALSEAQAIHGQAATGIHLLFDAALAAGASSANCAAVGSVRLDDREALSRAAGKSHGSDDCSDLDLILAAWERRGEDCFADIDGVFAVAIWDQRTERLVLARDALGERPLFFRDAGQTFLFGSLPLPLATVRGSPAPDLVRIAGYLIGHAEVGPRSFIAGVDRVMPGHLVIRERSGALRHKAWWKPDLSWLRIAPDDAVAAVREVLEKSVASALVSSAPRIAADLTGGLDSSLVVAAAAEILPEPERLLAITALPRGPLESPRGWFWDETAPAAETAAFHRVAHRIVPASPESPFAALDRWLPHSQAPIGNACNLGWIDASYEAARAAGADAYLTGALGNFTVSRSGAGRLHWLATSGNVAAFRRELAASRRFAGGTWRGHMAHGLAPIVPDFVWNLLVPPAHRRPLGASGNALLRAGNRHVAEADAEARAAGYTRFTFGDERPHSRLLSVRMVDPGAHHLGIKLRTGLDIRNPLGDRRLVELCLRLPPEHFFREGIPRRLARALLEGRAPDSVVKERRRGYQGANWRSGYEAAKPQMTTEIDRIGEDPELAAMLDVPRMRAMLDSWPSRNWESVEQIEQYRNLLFRPIGVARYARFVRQWAP